MRRLDSAIRELVVTGLLVAGCVVPAVTATAATVRPVPGQPEVVEMKNDLVTVRVDLARGAKVTSFRYAGFDMEDVVFDSATQNGGLCKDLWTTQGWPGEFDKRRYASKVVKNDAAEVVLETSTVSTGLMKGRIDETLSDLELVKTFTLRDGDRALHVSLAVGNPAKIGKRPAYWSQHAFDFDGQRKNTRYWRPTRHGVDMISQASESPNGYWYVAAPTAGWNGATNAAVRRGLMFLLDYNAVQQLYDNCAANTLEWMYDDTAIPAGKTWTTRMTVIPTEGFTGYRHGDATLVAHFETVETPAGLAIEHVLAAATTPLTDVTVKTLVRGAREAWEVEAEPFTAASVGFAPLVRAVNVSGAGPMPCLVEVTVTATDAKGEPRVITYADYFGGKVGRNLNLELLEPYHEFTPPRKKRQYLKPDTLALRKNATQRILFVRGLWADFQGVDETLKKLGDVEVVDGWMKKAALGETLGNFPASYDDLLAYDAIILANVSGGMLGDLGEEMLADFAKAGGGILFLSGDRTYGQAGFANQNLRPLIPAAFKTGGDYGRLETPSPLTAWGDHPLAAGTALPHEAVVLYAHDVTPANAGVAVLTLADGRPAVLASPPGSPRVAVVTPLPFGTVSGGERLLFDDPAWHAFLAKLVAWLTGGP